MTSRRRRPPGAQRVVDAIADTSIFVAGEHARSLAGQPEGDVLISVVTLTELRVGVLRAADARSRRARETTLRAAQRFVPLALDEPVAERLADLVARLRAAGRRVNLFDAIIAATAAAHDLRVWSQDGDFDIIADVAGGPPLLRG